MRSALLWLLVASMSFAYAQDSAVLKSVEPDYNKYSPDLTAGFETAVVVIVTVKEDGKPFAFNSVPLPMAVVMALKDYEFQPLRTVPHGRAGIDGYTHEVTLNLTVRQSKPVERIRIGPGIAKGMVVNRVQPVYPQDAKQNGIQGRVVLEAVITKEGNVESLKTSGGPFLLVEAAHNAVKQWHFRPYLENREPVEVITEIDIVFNLR